MKPACSSILRNSRSRRHPAPAKAAVRPVVAQAPFYTAASPAGIARPGARRSVPMRLARGCGRTLLALALLLTLTPAVHAINVDNVATASFTIGGAPGTLTSNTVTVVAGPAPTVATAAFLRLTTTPAGTLVASPDSSPDDPPVGVWNPVMPQPPAGTRTVTTSYDEGETIAFVVDDFDQNLDATASDTILVRLANPASGDSEVLRLYEDAPNSGRFVGYLPAGTAAITPRNGTLSAPAGSSIVLTYDDGGTPLTVNAQINGGAPLWLTLTTSRSTVGQGEAVPFTLSVENLSTTDIAPAVTVTQTLPAGFRYLSGSVRRGGQPVADPQIGSDGRTLTFTLGDLAAGEVRSLDFVAVVATAAPGYYPTAARARAGNGVRSNRPEVTLLIRDDLMSEKAFLAGRVLQLSDCGTVENGVGVPGVRIFLENGTFVITDSEGRYHIEGLSPGTHVLQLDPVTVPGYLEPALCENHTRFAGTPTSRFVDLQGGTLWLADFYLSEKRLSGNVQIALDNRFDGEERALYTVSFAGSEVPLQELELHVTLPSGVTFIPGTVTNLAGLKLADPTRSDDQELVFPLADPPQNWQKELRFAARLDNNSVSREIPAKAWLTFATRDGERLATPVAESALVWIAAGERREVQQLLLQPRFEPLQAELSETDRLEIARIATDLQRLDIQRILVVGHTDARQIRWREGVPYRDNVELSAARARAVADELTKQMQIDPAKIAVIGKGESEPAAGNDSDEGRARNRRTELLILHRVALPIAADQIEPQDGPEQNVAVTASAAPHQPAASKPPLGILSPESGRRLPHAVESVRVQVDARLEPLLTLDGTVIPASRIGFTRVDKESRTKLVTYIGVDFGAPGEHLLRLQCIDPFGNTRLDQTVKVFRTGTVHDIQLVDSDGNVADGRTPLELRLKLLDEQGEIVEGTTQLELRRGTLIPLGSERQRAPRTPETTMVEVGRDGVARFEPVSRAGRYRIVLGYGTEEEEIEISVRPEPRDWILVGLASGTAGYNSVSGHAESLPAGTSEDYYDDGRLAFFASGQVKGEWLLTAAYDSDKETRKDRSLYQTIDPDSYYTLYGDATAQQYAAASAEKLYVRIERERFHATFGDIDTGLTVTELGRYNRSLTGLQSEYAGAGGGYSLFASETGQSFVRDEMRGDGTSGLYRLSRTPLVLNSEKLVIETRDRLHSERIVATRTLQRHIDYDIDYSAGTLFFKAPVPSKDEEFNPVYIVVDYETFGGESDYLYGGRGYLRFFDRRLEVGATLLHEGQGNRSGDLYAGDATLKLGEETELRTEYASSRNDSAGAADSGDAWLAELRHRSATYDASAYLREAEADFGLGQQNASEAGMRKFGVDGRYRLGQAFSLNGELSRQENLSSGANREVAAGSLNYHSGRYTLSGGLRHAADEQTGGVSGTSEQVTFGGDWKATEALTLKARHEQSLGDNDNTDYPTRTTLGADYALTRSVTLFSAQEFSTGRDADTEGTRLGLRATPWDGGQVRSSVEQQLGEESRRRFANLGFSQSWQVTPTWALDGSLDRSQLLSGDTSRPLNSQQPAAAQNETDFSAVSLGSNLRQALWSWDNRVEFRSSDDEERWGLQSGYIVEPLHGLGFSLRTAIRHSDQSSGTVTSAGEVRFGLAWRPAAGRSIVLNRLDLNSEKQSGSGRAQESWRIVDTFKVHWRYGKALHLACQYGAKYVSEQFESGDVSGYTDLVGGEVRYDLNPRWDIGAHGKLLTSWAFSQRSSSAGLDVGYSPAKNLWLSVGYNVTGFTDRDFSAADYTAQGAYLKFRVKFDQESVRAALARF